MVDSKIKTFLVAVSIVIGTTIGAGILGIPYVASKAGLIIAIAYIILLGFIVLLVNLYLGEVILRTKKKYQLPGYSRKYLGELGKSYMNFALIFVVYSAIIAYILGIAESFSFLFFGNMNYLALIGLIFGLFMSFLIYRGLKDLKRYERWGVGFILGLLILIIIFFANKISFENLSGFNLNFLFLPFGVVLFALLSFTTLPEVSFSLGRNKKLMKKTLSWGISISAIFYILFTIVVVGLKGFGTPEVATLALGPFFVILGILMMFTSYLALGNALQDHFIYDSKYSKLKSWFLTAIIPISIFLIIQLIDFFSFTKLLSIGGAVSGGLMIILILLIVRKSKKTGDRKPEYKIPINWFIIILLSLIFIAGILREFLVALR